MPITISGDGTISGMTQFSASAQPSCLLGQIPSATRFLKASTNGDLSLIHI